MQMTNNVHRCNHYNAQTKSCAQCSKRRFYWSMLSLFAFCVVAVILKCNWPETLYCGSHLGSTEDRNENWKRYKACENEVLWSSFKIACLNGILLGFIVHRMNNIRRNHSICSDHRRYEDGFEVDGCIYCSHRFSYHLFKILYETLGKQTVGYKLDKKK